MLFSLLMVGPTLGPYLISQDLPTALAVSAAALTVAIWDGTPVGALFEAVSKVHDPMNWRFDGQGWNMPFGNQVQDAAYNILYNFPTMIPAAAYTGAAFMYGTPGANQLATDISKRR